ncbi:hypothetical protein Naga_101300g1, partial [Nannochloropsis gaditana]
HGRGLAAAPVPPPPKDRYGSPGNGPGNGPDPRRPPSSPRSPRSASRRSPLQDLGPDPPRGLLRPGREAASNGCNGRNGSESIALAPYLSAPRSRLDVLPSGLTRGPSTGLDGKKSPREGVEETVLVTVTNRRATVPNGRPRSRLGNPAGREEEGGAGEEGERVEEGGGSSSSFASSFVASLASAVSDDLVSLANGWPATALEKRKFEIQNVASFPVRRQRQLLDEGLLVIVRNFLEGPLPPSRPPPLPPTRSPRPASRGPGRDTGIFPPPLRPPLHLINLFLKLLLILPIQHRDLTASELPQAVLRVMMEGGGRAGAREGGKMGGRQGAWRNGCWKPGAGL